MINNNTSQNSTQDIRNNIETIKNRMRQCVHCYAYLQRYGGRHIDSVSIVCIRKSYDLAECFNFTRLIFNWIRSIIMSAYKPYQSTAWRKSLHVTQSVYAKYLGNTTSRLHNADWKREKNTLLVSRDVKLNWETFAT